MNKSFITSGPGSRHLDYLALRGVGFYIPVTLPYRQIFKVMLKICGVILTLDSPIKGRVVSTFIFGEISFRSSVRINGLIWSGPTALPGLRLPRNFVILAVKIWKSGIKGDAPW